MKLVAIETTAEYLGLTLLVEGDKRNQVFNVFEKKPLQQSELLIPALDRLLSRRRLKGSDIDVWAVDVGPGSFTGVRVGVSAARALAQGFDKPLMGVSSLEAMAYRASKKRPGALIAAIRPALAGEVYAAVYRSINNQLKPVLDPVWTTDEKFEAELKKLRKANQKQPFVRTMEAAHPEDVARIAYHTYSFRPSSKRFDYNAVVPLYLQPSWAERSHKHAAHS